jgi:hypothetical protein
MKKISFCISCKNRFSQLSQTLGVNLQHNREDEDIVEFVLIDLASEDGLQEWVLGNFKEELDRGYLRYFYTREMAHWHAPVAKNTSHYLATGEFLVNLDGDNFTGVRGGAFVYELFERYGQNIVLHQFNGRWLGGTYGRIGVHRSYFQGIGGYDESFESMGYQDKDLIDRLCEAGLRYRLVQNPLYSEGIANSKELGVKYSGSVLTWHQMAYKNEAISKRNFYSGKIIANNGAWGIRKNILTYAEGKLVPVPE